MEGLLRVGRAPGEPRKQRKRGLLQLPPSTVNIFRLARHKQTLDKEADFRKIILFAHILQLRYIIRIIYYGVLWCILYNLGKVLYKVK